jgi:hypothetical protein
MVRRSAFRWTLATFALLGGRAASAAPITETGVITNDFGAGEITQVPGAVNLTTPFAGDTSGWSLQSIGTHYDPTTDSLSIGLHEFPNAQGQLPIAGDAYGTGTEGDPSSQAVAGGVNPPGFAGDKSITVAFAPAVSDGHGGITAGTPVIVAGIPADKSEAGTGIDGFNVTSYKPYDPANPNLDVIQWSYGKTLTAGMGNVAFDPSSSHPEFEFNINNFAKISGINPAQGYYIRVYEGSLHDGGVGETDTGFMFIPGAAAQQNIPEPATILTWTFVLGGAVGLRLRRRVARRAELDRFE